MALRASLVVRAGCVTWPGRRSLAARGPPVAPALRGVGSGAGPAAAGTLLSPGHGVLSFTAILK